MRFDDDYFGDFRIRCDDPEVDLDRVFATGAQT